MQKIESLENSKIKFLKKLNQKKYREQFSKFSVENFIIIIDAQKSGFDFEELFVTESFIKKNKLKFDLLINNSKNNYEIFIIDEKINKSFSNLETPSGITAIYKRIESKIDFSKKIVYLNNISNPGNMGTILRSALAFGIKNIILDENCVDLYNFKTINSAKDSIFKLNIEFDENLKLLKKIKKQMKIFSTRLEKSSDLKILKKESIFCIVFGNESNGISEKIINLSDDFIKINMTNNIESLNVASSCAIIFHYIYNNSL
ncbi:MAG: RNA methyltransferase [Patescibacteria group bacterium]|nr:RNA methyltransferase [Patescibacteria group bacterium]MDD4304829.1 RNA methyltransferase [Patescibacteria group bacterium]MDD4695809.1 RNA methyltransferase [Patescibacteria group bacterium]